MATIVDSSLTVYTVDILYRYVLSGYPHVYIIYFMCEVHFMGEIDRNRLHLTVGDD